VAGKALLNFTLDTHNLACSDAILQPSESNLWRNNMKKRSLIVSLIAGSLVLGSSAGVLAGSKAGCERDGRQHAQWAEKRLERMSKKLDLTAEQQEAIKSLWQQQAKSERPDRPRTGLQRLNPNADDYAEQVQQQIALAQQRVAQHLQARADHKAALYAILTPEQEEMLQQMYERGSYHGGRGKCD
jgi:Spy/CpxP family protein refolding chaperone